MALDPNELTNRIESAFEAEWAKTKTIPLPGAGGEDRRLLFAAVAHGVLAYLKSKESETLTSITLQPTLGGDSTKYNVTRSELNISGP
jgi:hypothetical protein